MADYGKKLSHPESADLTYSTTRSTIQTHLGTNKNIMEFNNSFGIVFSIFFFLLLYIEERILLLKDNTLKNETRKCNQTQLGKPGNVSAQNYVIFVFLPSPTSLELFRLHS